MSDNPDFLDIFDWEHENAVHYYKLLTGPQFIDDQLPAKIEVVHDETKQKEEHDNTEVDKGTL